MNPHAHQTLQRSLEILELMIARLDSLDDFASSELIHFTISEARDLISHEEPGCGIEIILDNIIDLSFPITEEIYTRIVDLCNLMSLQIPQIERLQQLVQ